VVRVVTAAACILLFVFLAGFVVFASSIARHAGPGAPQADGIVVLTGGQQRLSEAARLLAEGRGKRLLISGANRMASREDLHRKSGLAARLFECCVDVGYDAHTTSGNAEETLAWARDKHFTKLIIVTSSYHMPRSLIELARVMPHVTLVPYPVVSGSFRAERWWLHAASIRLLLSEYVKFLPSAARFGVARLLLSWEGNALAGNGLTRASTS
jgi:uncharacterized SAM-binding protein YcdF (DUF218 family)